MPKIAGKSQLGFAPGAKTPKMAFLHNYRAISQKRVHFNSCNSIFIFCKNVAYTIKIIIYWAVHLGRGHIVRPHLRLDSLFHSKVTQVCFICQEFCYNVMFIDCTCAFLILLILCLYSACMNVILNK